MQTKDDAKLKLRYHSCIFLSLEWSLDRTFRYYLVLQGDSIMKKISSNCSNSLFHYINHGLYNYIVFPATVSCLKVTQVLNPITYLADQNSSF
jgi:hypothetical protein